ncbi:MAG TPA: hypothetical protein VMS76_06920 [Planctomycetota bacterium]|nr:hypothetical protein [Planctomycetota bacterium]
MQATPIEWGGAVYLAGEFTGRDGAGEWQTNYYGISGAPVVSTGGDLLGACSKTFGAAAQRVFGITPRAELDRLLERGRLLGMAPAWPSDVTEPAGVLEAGASVIVLDVWGDVVLGTTGHVTLVRDGAFLSLGHPINPSELGPCLYAAFRAPVLAIHPDGDHRAALTRLGEAFGAITYTGAAGCYGVRRWPIPSVELRCRLVSRSGRSLLERRCFVAADPRRWRASLGRAAPMLFWNCAPDVREGGEVEMSSPTTSHAFRVEPGSAHDDVRTQAHRNLHEFMRTLEEDVRRVEITIRLDREQA